MQSIEFHSRNLYINEALLNYDSVLGDTFSFKDKRCCHRHPGCSDSSCFIDVLFPSRVDANAEDTDQTSALLLCVGVQHGPWDTGSAW